jgi:indole-3-glycerol phosphate synthase
MHDVLKNILANKAVEVQQAKSQVSLEELRDKTGNMPKCRNFYKAVTKRNRRGINVIAEVKKASPSAGIIRADFDAVQIAKTYERCGADAISVLTDEKYFQGSLDYLVQVKEAVNVPVLRKDFIMDPYQVYQARVYGADAILLIAEALPIGELADLMILASELTLTVLLEVHGLDNLLKVRSLIGFPKKRYSVLGINNRDLSTLKVDINTTSRLADLADVGDRIVAESGISTRADVVKMQEAGASAILIGQKLCESDDIQAKFNELFT